MAGARMVTFVRSGLSTRVNCGVSAEVAYEYFLGSRSMGGIVLAMTLTATYISASSFIGGPGAAYLLQYDLPLN